MSSSFAEGPFRPERTPEPVSSPAPGILDLVLAATRLEPDAAAASLLELFLAEPSLVKSLSLWLRWSFAPGVRPEAGEIARRLGREIARLDALLSAQVNAILHHPQFQQIEAAWRGLHYLVEQSDTDRSVQVRVLGLSKRELFRDLDRAIEFDQSQLFKKVYESEFGMPGGTPYGLLLGDYEFSNHPDDVEMLRKISGTAAAAFAPFVAAAGPALLGLDRFDTLEQPLNLPRTLDQVEHLKWRALRDTDDARFIGLTLPRVLMRLPYADDGMRADGFRFREEVTGPRHEKYLWGNAAYAFGAVVVRAFARSGWLADIRGVHRDVEGGGMVHGLPVHYFATDKAGIAPKSSTDVIVTDALEGALSDQGLIPLCHCHDTELSAFCAAMSIQKPKKYSTPEATTNARISAMLQYVLCVSRFAHYLKAITRDKIGTFSEAAECEDYLHRWLQRYVTADPGASPEVKAELPLREAQVRVRSHPGKPGHYLCTAYLWPHFELDELVGTLKVTTELNPGRGG